MKRVFSTSAEVAHIWAQQNQNEGRTSKGHCFFEGAFIWSYGKHYCLGAILTNKKGEKLAVLNDDNSSLTTNGQRHEVRSAAAPELLAVLKDIFSNEYDLEIDPTDFDYEIEQGNQRAALFKNALTVINRATIRNATGN